jgi:hypothetical protein
MGVVSMADIQTITTFLGWCSVINIGLLMFYTIWLMAFRNLTKSIHSALLGIDQDELDSIYFQYLANYKLAVIVLSIVPYFALRIMI